MNFVSLFAQSYYYENSSVADSAASAGMIIFFLLFMFTIIVVSYVLSSFLLSRIFKKAGIESWKAWVPFYNNWLLLELGEQKGYWAVLALVPILNIVAGIFMLIAMYRVGISFGKEGVFVLLAIFVPIVWFAWLAFDSSTWHGPRLVNAQPLPPQDTTPTPPTSI